MAHEDRNDGEQQAGGEAPAAMQEQAGPPFWEWVMAGVGLVLLLASIGYFGYSALVRKTGAPVPVIEMTSIEQQGSRFVVLLNVHNRASSSAAALKVTGTLKRGTEVVEQSETEFQYLPGESSRQAGLFFSRNPREFDLELSPRSYQKP